MRLIMSEHGRARWNAASALVVAAAVSVAVGQVPAGQIPAGRIPPSLANNPRLKGLPPAALPLVVTGDLVVRDGVRARLPVLSPAGCSPKTQMRNALTLADIGGVPIDEVFKRADTWVADLGAPWRGIDPGVWEAAVLSPLAQPVIDRAEAELASAGAVPAPGSVASVAAAFEEGIGRAVGLLRSLVEGTAGAEQDVPAAVYEQLYALALLADGQPRVGAAVIAELMGVEPGALAEPLDPAWFGSRAQAVLGAAVERATMLARRERGGDGAVSAWLGAVVAQRALGQEKAAAASLELASQAGLDAGVLAAVRGGGSAGVNPAP